MFLGLSLMQCTTFSNLPDDEPLSKVRIDRRKKLGIFFYTHSHPHPHKILNHMGTDRAAVDQLLEDVGSIPILLL